MNDIESALQKKFLIDYPSDSARLLESLTAEHAATLLSNYPAEMTVPVFEKISPDFGALIASHLSDDFLKKLIPLLSHYYATNLLRRFSKEKRLALLHQIPLKSKHALNKALRYASDSAGALMEADFIALQKNLTVAQAISRLQQLPHHARRMVFIVDAQFHLENIIDLQALVLAQEDTLLEELARPVQAYVYDTDDTDKVVFTLEKYRITDLPVIDYEGRLVGVIPYDTLMDASREEATADMLTMVGASKDERALSPALFAIKKRLPWLQINLLTAFLAASVVGLFENTIATFTVLAVLMPIVAGQSGNTGSQALAVTLRGLALREVQTQQWFYILFKEGRVAFINGIAVALTTSLGVFLWSHSIGLGLIIGISMIISMFIAGLAGAAVPLVLSSLKQDPAQSSTVILTTITDVCGFSTFLGTATLLSFLLT